MKKEKLITITSGGPLPELNFITGPVLYPWYVDIETITRLVVNKRKVYEVNPENREERILLTIKNVKLQNFPVIQQTTINPGIASKPQTPINPGISTPKPQPTPVQPEQKPEVTTKPQTDVKPTITKPEPTPDKTEEPKAETPVEAKQTLKSDFDKKK